MTTVHGAEDIRHARRVAFKPHRNFSSPKARSLARGTLIM